MPVFGNVQCIDIFNVSFKTANAYPDNQSALILTNTRVASESITVEPIGDKSSGGNTIRIKRAGFTVASLGNMSIPTFTIEFPEVAKRLGFKIIEYPQEKKRHRYESNFHFEIPDLITLNRNLNTLRGEGILPKNGINFVFVRGELSTQEYLDLFLSGRSPIAVDSLFFHDVNGHMLGLILMPTEVANLYRKEIQLLKHLQSAELSTTRTGAINEMMEHLSRVLDSTSVAIEESSGFPPLDKISRRIGDLQMSVSLFKNTFAIRDLDALLRSYIAMAERFSGIKYQIWLEQQRNSLYNVKPK